MQQSRLAMCVGFGRSLGVKGHMANQHFSGKTTLEPQGCDLPYSILLTCFENRLDC